jgi:hypothetical protein
MGQRFPGREWMFVPKELVEGLWGRRRGRQMDPAGVAGDGVEIVGVSVGVGVGWGVGTTGFCGSEADCGGASLGRGGKMERAAARAASVAAGEGRGGGGVAAGCCGGGGGVWVVGAGLAGDWVGCLGFGGWRYL